MSQDSAVRPDLREVAAALILSHNEDYDYVGVVEHCSWEFPDLAEADHLMIHDLMGKAKLTIEFPGD